MTNQPIVLRLPYEVLDLIVDLLVRSFFEDGERQEFQTRVIGQLRLVCQDWASALIHRLYLSLHIANDEHSNKILSRWTKSSHLDIKRDDVPRTQKLSVKQLWIGQDVSQIRRDNTFSSFENVERLLVLFSSTLTELELDFINCFDFTPRVIETISQLQCLSSLRISISAERIINSDAPIPVWSGTQGSYQTDSLLSILRTARDLFHLDFTRLPSLPLPRGPLSGSFSAINHLEFDYFGDQSSDTLVNLCIALKESLRILSIRGFRQETAQLNPVFEAVQNNLEGLFVSDESLLTDALQLSFPRLKVFRIYYWGGCISHFLIHPMFQTVRTIALYAHTVHRRRRAFGLDPFQNMPNLKQLIFTHTHIGDETPINYVKACRAHNIDLVHINHGGVPGIMKLDSRLLDGA